MEGEAESSRPWAPSKAKLLQGVHWEASEPDVWVLRPTAKERWLECEDKGTFVDRERGDPSEIAIDVRGTINLEISSAIGD